MSKLNEKIKLGLKNVKPKPRWEFVTYDLIKDLVLAGLIVMAVLIVGATVYIVRQYNPWSDLPAGWNYHLEALKSLPWELIVFCFILITLVYIAAKKINNFYRINPLYIFLAIVVLIGAGYFIAEGMGFNKKMAEIPVAKNIYQKQGKIILVGRGIIVSGEVRSVNSPKMIVVDTKHHTWQIVATAKTHILTPDKIEAYDFVTVNGIKIDNDNIEAFLIREMDENWRGFYEDIMKARSMHCVGCTK